MSSGIDAALLIALVEEKPELWDRNLAIYKDRNKTRESWRTICCTLNPRFEKLKEADRHNYGQLVLKKWNNIRDQYMKSKNKEEKASKSGARKCRKYVYHEALQFLEKIRTPSEPTSTTEPSGAEEGRREKAALEPPLRESRPKPSTGEPSVKRQPTKRRRTVPEYEPKPLPEPGTKEPDPDRHLLFFKGILPSIAHFNDAQIIDFQMGVLQLVKNIRQGSTAVQPLQSPFGSIYGSFGQPSYQASQQYNPVSPTQLMHHGQLYEVSHAQSSFAQHVFHERRASAPTAASSNASDHSSEYSVQDRKPEELVVSQLSD